MKNIFFIVIVIVLCVNISTVGQPLKIDMRSTVKENYSVQAYQTDMGGGGYIVGIIQDRGPRRKENFHFSTAPLKSRLPDTGRRLFIVSSTVWWYPRTGHRGGYP